MDEPLVRMDNRPSSGEYLAEALMLEAAELMCEVMEANGWSRAEFARRVGRDRGYITRILQGEKNVSIRKYAEMLGAAGYRVRMTLEEFARPQVVTCWEQSSISSVPNWVSQGDPEISGDTGVAA